MENQEQNKNENLFERDTNADFSSGPLAAVSDDAENDDMDDEDETEDELAADDELDEDL